MGGGAGVAMNRAWKMNDGAVVEFVKEEVGEAWKRFCGSMDMMWVREVKEVRETVDGELANLVSTDGPYEVASEKKSFLVGMLRPTMSMKLDMRIKELEAQLAHYKELRDELEKQPQVQGLLDKLSQLHI